MKIIPRTPAPELNVQLVGGDSWSLADQQPERFTLLVFYRGYHCPICKKQLKELDRDLDKFAERGVQVLAVSSDTEERAEKSVNEWELERLPVAFGLSLDAARDWGLFVSSAIKDGEPERFTEPGLFLIAPDGTLYASIVQTMPFVRPSAEQLLESLKFITEKDYPARGEVAGL